MRDINWIERRADMESRLAAEAPERWNEIRSALQDACESYRSHYSKTVDCKLKNGMRVCITKHSGTEQAPQRTQVIVAYYRENNVIDAVYDTRTIQFQIVCRQVNGVVVTHENSQVDADEVSRIILEPILFPSPKAHAKA